MDIVCLQTNAEYNSIENEEANFRDYDCQEIFYPLWLLEVEVCMHLLFSKVKRMSIKVAVDGFTGDISFICKQIETYHAEVKLEQLLPVTAKMDAEGLVKVKDSLLPFVLSKARSFLVRPSINIQNKSIIFKPFYRLSSMDGDDRIIYLDKSNGKIAVLRQEGKSNDSF
ncbi:MAG TPA: hypothetical protein DCS12_12435 [Clostridiales bacterium]|nr:hypothetical protein [Clostridiales bacterium]